MKKPFFYAMTTAFFMLFMVVAANAQYKSAVGLRLGYPWAVSYKTFISDAGALEVYGSYRGYKTLNWFGINGAYQHHMPISGVDNLSWYVGGGLGVYFWNFDFDTDANTTTLGLQGYLGLDYKFKTIPLNLSIDWIPTFALSGYYDGFRGEYFTLAARYVLSE